MEPGRVSRQLAFAVATAALFAPARLLSGQDTESQARQVFTLTNQDRQQHGLPALRWDSALAAAAQAHAELMVRRGTLSHQLPGEPDLTTRAAAAGAHFQAIAENIAIGESPKGIERGWMNSTPHRTNILDPRMNAIGVAVVPRGASFYAVEDFSQASAALTRDQVERRVRELLLAENVDPSSPAGPAEQACSMAHGIPQGLSVRSIVRFETPDLTELPAQVAQQIRGGDFRKAAVGACAPVSSQPGFTTYRVAILFY
jgi:uncharacterized protein YkwD